MKGGKDVKLNLFEITVPPKVKRLYYHNPQTQPEIFAKNMSRINNIRFVHSSDLVWIELPFVQTKILPDQADNYKKGEELIENDEKLFIRTLYGFMGKLFKDNNFIVTRDNVYISSSTKTPLKSNKEVCYFESYKIKIYKIKEKFYLSINPRFTFLSAKPALDSEVKSTFVLNTKSGKSFPFVNAENSKLVIAVDKKTQKEVAHPEWYFFNFTSKEAEKLRFSKEVYQIYEEKLNFLYEKMLTELGFLNKIVNLSTAYEVNPSDFERIVVFYKFASGNSDKIKDIFELKPLKSQANLKVTFLFSSDYKNKDIEEPVKMVFASDNSAYNRSLHSLGFKKIEYLRDPQTNKAIFYYQNETFELEKKDILSSSGLTYAIVLLEKEQDSLKNLLEKSPKNLIVLPVLKRKITDNQVYILRSFAYKFLNFSKDAQPYQLIGLSRNIVYIGFDLSHDHQKRKSSYAFSAVDSQGKVLYINQKPDLPLNEELEIDLVEKDVVKSIDRYKSVHGQFPETFFLMRDGVFLEDINLLKNHLDLMNTKYAVVEINKNSNINSAQNLKGMLIRLQDSKYVYFPQVLHVQKAVEIKIVLNNTKLSNDQIAKEIYLTTRLFHPTPYTNLKLPYPLYITDKVSLLEYEWKLYVPYFMTEL